MSDSRLKDFAYVITIKAYLLFNPFGTENNLILWNCRTREQIKTKETLVCPNPRGKKDFLEKFKNEKEKERFYLTLKDFMNKKNWSQSHTVNSNVISNNISGNEINKYLKKVKGDKHFITTMGENYTS